MRVVPCRQRLDAERILRRGTRAAVARARGTARRGRVPGLSCRNASWPPSIRRPVRVRHCRCGTSDRDRLRFLSRRSPRAHPAWRWWPSHHVPGLSQRPAMGPVDGGCDAACKLQLCARWRASRRGVQRVSRRAARACRSGVDARERGARRQALAVRPATPDDVRVMSREPARSTVRRAKRRWRLRIVSLGERLCPGGSIRPRTGCDVFAEGSPRARGMRAVSRAADRRDSTGEIPTPLDEMRKLPCATGGAAVNNLRSMVIIAMVALSGTRASAQATNNPHGDLRESCSTCHRAESWKPVRVSKDFRHAPRTFELDGAHATTSCMSCHRRLDFKGTGSTCSSCHSDVHNGELGADCARCHTTRSFIDRAGMERAHERTRFPLRGAHATASCEACHTPSASGAMRFVNRPSSCIGCHAPAFAAAKNPDHQGAGFSRECTACHTILSWSGAQFDHSTTAFALTGAHGTVSCAGCHADGTFRGKSMECVSCHRSDYDRATKPAHAGFPTVCADCHVTAEWTGAKFDHQATRFPLTGAHQATSCASCHRDGLYRGTSADCVSCHRGTFERTTTPPHTAAGFSTTCSNCHTTTRWPGVAYDHSTTRFPLTGSHIPVSCSGCHSDGVYVGKSLDCYSCHRASYEGTRNPPHAAAGFGLACTNCHTTTAWPGAVFNHSTTQFPLTGAHVATACASCHNDGMYDGKSTDCYSCHRTKYDQTTNPPHAPAGFPNACATCHNTTAWPGAVFNHSATRFALTGAHLAVPCNACHADGVSR